MSKLVEYSSSESEDESRSKPAAAVASTMKLPMLLKVESSVSRRDSPSDHQNRTRQIPHVEGNWATHVFIDYPLAEQFSRMLESLCEELPDVNLIESTHISLSKTFILKHHWIESFIKTLKKELERSSPEFTLQLSTEVVFLSNEDRSRHFACIPVDESCKMLVSEIIHKVDKCLKEYDLPVYYKEHLIHLSVLWKTSEFTKDEKNLISQQLLRLLGEHRNYFNLLVDKVSCKTGNKLFEIVIA